MDFNDFLRNTKTAAEEAKASASAPLAGLKRNAEKTDAATVAAAHSSSEPTAKRARRSSTAEGLNLQAAQEALAQERGTTTLQAQQQRAQAELLSEQAAARMVHQVLEYVLQAELGGRHNASKGGVPPFVPSAAQLAAERAMSTSAANYSIHHVVPATTHVDSGSSTSSDDGLDRLMSVTEKQRVPDGVRTLRASLQTCDIACDLVGGVRSGMAPHLRAHVLEVLERGLRGEAWQRDDAAAATQFSALGKPTTPEQGPASVLLFRDAAPRTTAGAPNEQMRDAQRTPASSTSPSASASGFSLTAFLNDNDDSSSLSDDGVE